MMSNIIKMKQQEAIAGLKAQGWSNRKIAKELRINHRTVKHYVESKCTIAQTGKVGIPSLCLAYKTEIKEWHEGGLSIERMRAILRWQYAYLKNRHS